MEIQIGDDSPTRFDHSRKWNDLVNLGLLPGVTSEQEYDVRCLTNIARTRAAITSTEYTLDIPQVAEILFIHDMIFKDIHP